MTTMDEHPHPFGAQPPLPPPPPPIPGTSSAPSLSPPPARRARTVVAAVTAVAVLVALGSGIGWELTLHDRTVTTGAAPSSSTIAARVTPAVVDINTFTIYGTTPGTQPLGAGTGLILTSSGEVLTNNHVVRSATQIQVTVPGRGTYQARVVGVDPTDDVALIQLQGVSGLPTVTLGDPGSLHVGDPLVAIGNALGRGGVPTSTSGSVTGLNRTITANDENGGSEQLNGMIQTDALIRPGDSGGALVNGAGQVVGMITAGSQTNGRSTAPSAGFAINATQALDVVNQIRSGQRSSTILIGPVGFLGVEISTANPTTPGALVAGVVDGTPAARAGITANSAITVIDGQRIGSADALGTVLHRYRPGDRITVTWDDATGTHSSSVTLIAGPAV